MVGGLIEPGESMEVECVQTLLKQWRLRAIAYTRPGYEEAVQDAVRGRVEVFVQCAPAEWKGRV